MALRFKTAIGTYGHTASLKNGRVQPAGIDFAFIEIEPIIAAFRRMIRALEFDVSEMAITTYLCAKSFRKPITALPIFLLRSFPHAGITYNVKSGIKEPKDLEGRRVGVRAYTVTSGLWARGMLKTEYGVDLDKVTWVIVDEEHVQEYEAPPRVVSMLGKNLGEMLLSGEIDAAIGAGDLKSDDVKPLIPDAAARDADSYRRTGVYPINHTLVVRDEHLQQNPWVAEALFAAFKTAKEVYLDNLGNGDGQAERDDRLLRARDLVGGDPLPYGVKPNVKTLEKVIEFNVDQRIIPRPVSVESLFFPSTLELE